jgi:proline dehydrogenase
MEGSTMLREGLLFLSGSRTAKKLLTGTPLTRSMSRRFVPGETVEDLLGATRAANREGLKVTANYLGEAVRDRASARAAADAYLRILEAIGREKLDANVSLKFTQMGQDIDPAFLAENLGRLLEKGREDGTFIRFDMESSAYTQRTLDSFEALWTEGWREIGVALQSYLKRTPGDVARMIDLGARVRLCKGAYAEPPSVAFQDPEEVSRSFVHLMRPLLAEGNYPGIATHDERMIQATVAHARREGIGPQRFEFQMLYGVRRDLQRQLVADGWNVRVYIPFGEAWYPYLMRRLAERPANVLFMAGSVVRESPLGFLWPSDGGAR